jgi:hypothetical protein
MYKKYQEGVNINFSNNVIITPCDHGDGQGSILHIPDGEEWNEAREALSHLEDAEEPILSE